MSTRRRGPAGRRRRRAGVTLIEIMVASVVLAVMAIAAAAYIYHSQGQIGRQRNRRVALELANNRLELLRAEPYKPAAASWTYLTRSNDTWQATSLIQKSDSVDIGGRRRSLTTRVRPSGTVSNYYEAVVEIAYGSDGGETLELTTAYFQE